MVEIAHPNISPPKYGAFSHDITAAVLVFQSKEMAAMSVYQTKPLGIELHFHANFSFCGMKLTWPLVMRMKTLYTLRSLSVAFHYC